MGALPFGEARVEDDRVDVQGLIDENRRRLGNPKVYQVANQIITRIARQSINQAKNPSTSGNFDWNHTDDQITWLVIGDCLKREVN